MNAFDAAVRSASAPAGLIRPTREATSMAAPTWSVTALAALAGRPRPRMASCIWGP
jgi:hypothetical protein